MTEMATDRKSGGAIQALQIGTEQTISVASSSEATSNAFADTSGVVRVVSTTDCHLAFAASPTATTSNTYLPANQVEYFKVPAPGTSKLAAIRANADGTLFVTEMA